MIDAASNSAVPQESERVVASIGAMTYILFLQLLQPPVPNGRQLGTIWTVHRAWFRDRDFSLGVTALFNEEFFSELLIAVLNFLERYVDLTLRYGKTETDTPGAEYVAWAFDITWSAFYKFLRQLVHVAREHVYGADGKTTEAAKLFKNTTWAMIKSNSDIPDYPSFICRFRGDRDQPPDENSEHTDRITTYHIDGAGSSMIVPEDMRNQRTLYPALQPASICKDHTLRR